MARKTTIRTSAAVHAEVASTIYNNYQFYEKMNYAGNAIGVTFIEDYVLFTMKLSSNGEILVDDIMSYTCRIEEFFKEELNAEVVNAGSAKIRIDHETFYDEPDDVEVFLDFQFKVIEWNLFTEYHELLKLEEKAYKEKLRLAKIEKRKATTAAKIKKEQDELALLAELKKKYPNA